MIFGIIYKATNIINGKVYIGQTVKALEKRISGHYSNARKNTTPGSYFFKAIRKHGEGAFKWDVIDEADNPDELNQKEIYWISHYNSNGKGGYNLTDGGEGVRGYKVTEEGVERRRKVLKEMWKNGHGKNFPKGEDAVAAKFTDLQIRRIGELLMRGEKPSVISKEYNIHTSSISSIRIGKVWNHLFTEEEIEIMKTRGSKGANWLSESVILEIKDLLLYSPMFNKEIAIAYNVSENVVYNIQISKKWRYLFSEEDKMILKKKHEKNKMSFEKIKEIKLLLEEDKFNQVEIAWIMQASNTQVGRIKRGEIWSDITKIEKTKIRKSKKQNLSYQFTENEILEIKSLLLYSPMKHKDIAESYGIKQNSFISFIKNKKWSHIFSESDYKKIGNRREIRIQTDHFTVLIDQPE